MESAKDAFVADAAKMVSTPHDDMAQRHQCGDGTEKTRGEGGLQR